MMLAKFSRRSLLGCALGLVLTRDTATNAAEIYADNSGLADGRFVWQPRLALTGPVLILCSPTEQSLSVYRGGVRIGISTFRVGDGAHQSLGILQLIDQSQRSHSPAPAGAPSRRGWQVAASFAEGLGEEGPGLPIRLPPDFAKLLLEATAHGATIVTAPRRTVPIEVTNGLGAEQSLLTDMARRVTRGAETAEAMGEEAHIVVSATTRTATLVVAGTTRSTCAIEIADPKRPLGTQIFSALGATVDGASLRWIAVGLAPTAEALKPRAADTGEALARIRFSAGPERDAMFAAIGPRTAIVLTDAAATAATRVAAPGFEIFAAGGSQARPSPRVAATASRPQRTTRRGLARTAEGNEPAELRPSTLFRPY